MGQGREARPVIAGVIRQGRGWLETGGGTHKAPLVIADTTPRHDLVGASWGEVGGSQSSLTDHEGSRSGLEVIQIVGAAHPAVAQRKTKGDANTHAPSRKSER